MAALAVTGAGAYFKGKAVVQERFDAFKSQVEIQGKAQIESNKRMAALHEQAKEDIQDEYEKRLADLRQSYALGVRKPDPRGSRVSTVPKPTTGAAATAADHGLALRCAETTLQLVELLRWHEKISSTQTYRTKQ